MASIRYRGTLTVWKDDRGFGFVQPGGESEKVFLHISALPRYDRRPREGDRIDFSLETDPTGKRRAVAASIVGLEPQSPTRSTLRRYARSVMFPVLAMAAVVAGIGTVCSRHTVSPPGRIAAELAGLPAPAGPIKGNISVNSGARLYHVPGMRDYEITVIDPARGERWFRTEAEAQAAGWRRADGQ